MRACGLLGDEERLGDLAVGLTLGDQHEHLELARREPGPVLSGRSPRMIRGRRQLDARTLPEQRELAHEMVCAKTARGLVRALDDHRSVTSVAASEQRLGLPQLRVHLEIRLPEGGPRSGDVAPPLRCSGL